uniref:Uncharacterized protein n=1 Tax=Arundo donax TaxID=35708 RepID=A0A0A9A8T4_ARUDO
MHAYPSVRPFAHPPTNEQLRSIDQHWSINLYRGT